MRYLFKLIFQREKVFLTLVVIIVLVTSFTTLFQAVVAANLLNSSITAGVLSANAAGVVTAWNPQDTGLLRQVMEIINLAATEGNEAATRYVIEQRRLSLLFALGIVLVTILALSQFFIFGKELVINILSRRVAFRLRKLVFARLLNLPNVYFHAAQSGSIIQRLTGDTAMVEKSIVQIIEKGFFGPVFSGLGICLLVYLDYRLALVIFTSVVVIFFVINYLAYFIRILKLRMVSSVANVNTHIYKVFSMIEAVKIFSRERWERRRYQSLLNAYLKNWLLSNILTRLARPINELIGLIGVIVVIFYGTALIWQQEFSAEELFIFLFVLLFIVPYFQRITDVPILYRELSIAVERILHIVNSRPEHAVFNMGKTVLQHYKGKLTFANVSVDYTKEIADVRKLEEWSAQRGNPKVSTAAVVAAPALALEAVSFTIHPREAIAIVGESGSGKTTLVNLIAQFLPPTSGQILFDDCSHSQFSIKSIRQQLSMVTQETFLFNLSILENVRYGRLAATKSEVQEACHLAQIHDFITSLPDGYGTVIGERGVKLSGGQKQRLALARALLKRSRILILDEATSALDAQSEREVQHAIDDIMRRQTTFIIAHRFSTIAKVDRILVLSKGRLVEIGTHQQLMANRSVYFKLHQIQFDRLHYPAAAPRNTSS